MFPWGGYPYLGVPLIRVVDCQNRVFLFLSSTIDPVLGLTCVEFCVIVHAQQLLEL